MPHGATYEDVGSVSAGHEQQGCRGTQSSPESPTAPPWPRIHQQGQPPGHSKSRGGSPWIRPEKSLLGDFGGEMGQPCWGGGTCPMAAVTPTFPWVWSDTQTQTGCPGPPASGASVRPTAQRPALTLKALCRKSPRVPASPEPASPPARGRAEGPGKAS